MTPVKSLRLHAVDEIVLDRSGVRGDRRFLITDAQGHLVNGKHLGGLMQLVAEFPPPYDALTVRFPDGTRLVAEVEVGEASTMLAYGELRSVCPVLGPWSAALSAWTGTELRLVQAVDPADGVDRRREGGVTLLSSASVDALAEAAGVDRVDPRRFRMTVGVDGFAAFEEEALIGRVVEIGEAAVLVKGNVGRCAVTTRDPETGDVDFPTLHLLRDLRAGVDSTEPLPFGVWGEVVEPGPVHLGDAVGPR
jgi:uncharacterized protein YcbX